MINLELPLALFLLINLAATLFHWSIGDDGGTAGYCRGNGGSVYLQ